MKKYKLEQWRSITLLALLLTATRLGLGQTVPNEIELKLGDPAPPIKYSKWLKGEPVDSFDPQRVYVLEFWATWCGPCKANMPHLTELQKKYKNDVTIIGVGAMERVPSGKLYDASLPMVEKFVKGNSENMGYAVMADNNDQFMTNKWFKASGQNGIPVAYIVKDSKVVWIGHPASMDTVLQQVVNGTYDVEAYKKASSKRASAFEAREKARAAAMKPVNDAVEAKDYKTAFALMDKLIAEQPNYRSSLDIMRFKILLDNFSTNEMIAFAGEWIKSGKLASYTFISEISGKENLSKETYLWAANSFVNVGSSGDPRILDLLAKCFEKGGDLKNAVIIMGKAAEIGRAALNNPAMAGAIDEATVAGYEKRVKEYQEMLK